MKTISRYIMTLALLITAVGGAWADETYTVQFKANGNTKTVENVVLPHQFRCSFSSENGELDQIIKELYGLSSGYCMQLIKPSDNENVTSGVDDNDDYITISAPFEGTAKVTGNYYLGGGDDLTYSLEISIPGYIAGPAVTINDTKTEASFNMPTSDVTAEYELVRDMSVQMTAQVGDGTDGVRYRVKKDGNKFIPADMEMAAVPALFTVNDAIEQKALTQTQDYIVQIYAIDAEGQPTGEAMTFATFTFEPGIYAVKAVAADGSDYDGETALSNTFQLFQGYEVTVAAKEFITYYKDEPLYVEDEAAELYTISSVNGDQAVLSEKSDAMPSNTPMLVYNKSNETKVILLIPCNEPDLALTVAPEFQGTLNDSIMPASSEGTKYYICNGYDFVWVRDAGTIAANRCWLKISNSNARALNIVFSDLTEVKEVKEVIEVKDDSFYDLNGRKVATPKRKGVYIQNGRKVVVK